MTTMTPQRARSLYELRCKLNRAHNPQASKAYAVEMSAACREYEANMARAASEGDQQAASALAASAGPYLNL
jgi:hypothetical protein